ncbi:MAG: glycosyltransferase family 2 protein, partial [Deltaproteobacteria bacterium]|nr:glycosyltransferase family 2 protein [Deltaproteobacteria bacterium]
MKIVYPKDYSSASIQELLDAADSDVLFLGDPHANIEPGPRMLDRMAQVIRETGAGWIYADAAGHPRIDYQSGSIRDGFDFGPVVGVSVDAARHSGIDNSWKWGGLYDLRLRISEKYAIIRIPEPLYSASTIDARPTDQKQFDYVDPRNRDYQIEMEQIATAHLKRI